jgi:hypothetical protein
LIKAEDIALPGDTFTAAPPTENPNGKSGLATVFSNQGDTREIKAYRGTKLSTKSGPTRSTPS